MDRQKSYGKRYYQNKFKIKIRLKHFIIFSFIIMFAVEIVLGLLWALGY